MKNYLWIICTLTLTAMTSTSTFAKDKELVEETLLVKEESLFEVIEKLDTLVFDAFNNCKVPAELEKHAGYFSEDVEFYHDNGGVTWSRDEMIANTEKHVCGNFRRELVPGTLRVFPIKGFGAIAIGTHRFCQFDTGKCEGIAEFTNIWKQQSDQWIITRVLSYGHRPDN